ncbi:MAG: DUF4381 domain-containing protein [Pseudomonadales bacterium]
MASKAIVWKMAKPEILDANFGNYTIQGIDEIVMPPGVSWLPATLAWKILGLILLVVAALMLLRALKNWRANEYRRLAIKKLAVVRDVVRSSDAGSWHDLSDLATLMKSAALQAYSREDVASLSGDSWLRFLGETSKRNSFDTESAEALTKLAYQRHTKLALNRLDAEKLLDQCERWIRQHKTTIGLETGD